MPRRSTITGKFLKSSSHELEAPRARKRRKSARRKAPVVKALVPWGTPVEAPRKRKRARRRRRAAPKVHHEGWSLQTVLVPTYVGSAETAAAIAREKVRARTPKVDVKGEHYRFQQWPSAQIGPGRCRSKKIGKKSAGWEATLVYCDRKPSGKGKT